MTIPSIELLVIALHGDARLSAFLPEQWDVVIRQGRVADLLARIGAIAIKSGLWESIPAAARMHIGSELNLASRQQRELLWEVQQIADALAPANIPVVLLKGAAYVMAGLQAAQGRLVSDVDVLVPRRRLSEVESALMMHGWVSSAKSEYDQRYYRTWMHELPPMQHFRRGTTIDVHHAILPLTARYHPGTAKLLEATRVLPGSPIVQVLSPVDMVLHSAAHLFHEGELDKGLKGLVDLECLCAEFGVHPDFWPQLVHRAHELELARPLFYALRYTEAILGTAIPTSVLPLLQSVTEHGPTKLHLALMDALFLRALRPRHPSASDAFTPIARWLLYLRGHWLRMPFWLLIPHLIRKSWAATHEKKAKE